MVDSYIEMNAEDVIPGGFASADIGTIYTEATNILAADGYRIDEWSVSGNMISIGVTQTVFYQVSGIIKTIGSTLIKLVSNKTIQKAALLTGAVIIGAKALDVTKTYLIAQTVNTQSQMLDTIASDPTLSAEQKSMLAGYILKSSLPTAGLLEQVVGAIPIIIGGVLILLIVPRIIPYILPKKAS